MFRLISLSRNRVIISNRNNIIKLSSGLRSPLLKSAVNCQLIARDYSFFTQDNRRRNNIPLKDKIKNKFNNLTNSSKGLGPIATIGLGGSFLFGKAKYLFVALKLTKFTPFISMVISAGAYSMFFGWPYACGMVGLIFVHELGHAFAMKFYKVPFSPMVFIPFMGAAIAMQHTPKNAFDEGIIALAGPVLGSVGAVSLSLAAPHIDTHTNYLYPGTRNQVGRASASTSGQCKTRLLDPGQ